jgi:hypothetical protein
VDKQRGGPVAPSGLDLTDTDSLLPINQSDDDERDSGYHAPNREDTLADHWVNRLAPVPGPLNAGAAPPPPSATHTYAPSPALEPACFGLVWYTGMRCGFFFARFCSMEQPLRVKPGYVPRNAVGSRVGNAPAQARGCQALA